MLGVSTSWKSRAITDGERLIEAVTSLGVTAVELDFRLSAETLRSAVTACEKSGVTILSVHAVCPAPADKSMANYAEAFQICATDEDTRGRAVADVKKTIDLCVQLGAQAVVLHCGAVPMEKVTLELQRRYDQGTINTSESARLVNEYKIMRLRSRGAGFDALLKSLDEICEAALSQGARVGLENRYYFHEYPNFEELAIIFETFGGWPLGYWHDTGHAQAQENLGYIPHETYLKEFGDMMIGAHIHDVDGYTDHLQTPCGGKGGVDFAMLKKYLKPDTIKILELRGEVTEKQAKDSVEWLSRLGLA